LKRYERYLIWATVIFFATVLLVEAFTSPERYLLFWGLLTVLCITAIGMFLERRTTKPLLWLFVASVSVLIYEALFILNVMVRGFLHDPEVAQLYRWARENWLILTWVALTLYLLWWGKKYKEELESAEAALERRPSHCPHCGAQL
jgi:prepilin signal peptidase PulO-like enzyme (type II secretory pathway)